MSNAQDPWHHLWDLHGEPKSCTSRDANRLKNVAISTRDGESIRVTTQTDPSASQPVQEKPHPYRSRRKRMCQRRNPHTGRRIQTCCDANQPISVATCTGEGTPVRITTRMDETASQSVNGNNKTTRTATRAMGNQPPVWHITKGATTRIEISRRWTADSSIRERTHSGLSRHNGRDHVGTLTQDRKPIRTAA